MLRLFQALITYDDGQHPGQYYLIVEAIPHVVATAFVVASVIVGDVILVSVAERPVLPVSESLRWLDVSCLDCLGQKVRDGRVPRPLYLCIHRYERELWC